MKEFVVVLSTIWAVRGFPQDVFLFPQDQSEVEIQERVPNSCVAVNGQECVFPFIFQGTTYNECTYAGNSATAWCALERNSRQEVVVNRWADCEIGRGNCPVETNIVNIAEKNNKECFTTGGPHLGKKCIFPFIHGAIQYHDCTRAGHKENKLWCSTKVDSSGRHLAGQDFFGTCSALCFGIENANNHLWNTWSGWGACSGLCGGYLEGVQERTRTCAGTNCVGNKAEYKSCLNVAKCTSGAACKSGANWKQDCNTCICTSEGKTVCTTLQCQGNSGRCSGGTANSDPQCAGGAGGAGPVTPAPTTLPTAAPCTTARDRASPHCRVSNVCVTASGPTTNQACVFPFKWSGKTFTNCDVWRWGGKDDGKFWCSTKTDANGVHINGQGNYGFCPDTEPCRGIDLTVNNRILEVENEPELQIAPN